MRTHYDNLKVEQHVGSAAITAAYQRLREIHNPRKYPESLRSRQERIMQILLHSYIILSSPSRRAAHDRWIKSMTGYNAGEPETHPSYNTPTYDIYNDFDFEFVKNATIYTTPLIRFILWCIAAVGAVIIFVLTMLMTFTIKEKGIVQKANETFHKACNSLTYPIISGNMRIDKPCYMDSRRNMIMEVSSQTPRRQANINAIRAVAAQSVAVLLRETSAHVYLCSTPVITLGPGLNFIYKITYRGHPPEYITIPLTNICNIIYSSNPQ